MAALLLAATLLASGCTQLISIDEDALVTGVAFDSGSRPGQVAVAMEWSSQGSANASGGGAVGGGGGGGAGGGGGGGGGGKKPTTMSGSGPDVAAAVAVIRQQTDKRVVVFSCDLVVLGEDLARQGVAAPLNYLWRAGTFPETAQMAVARGQAAKLLASPFPGGIGVHLSRRLTRSQWTDTGSIPIPNWRFLARMLATGEAPWAPMFVPTPHGFRADGTALFVGDRMTGEVDQSETPALSWLLKPGGYGSLLLPGVRAAGEPVTLRVRSRRLRVSVESPTRARLRLSLLTEVSQGASLFVQDRNPKRLEAQAGRQAQRDVRAVLDRLQSAGSDVLALGERLRERDPAAVHGWPQKFRRMRIQLRVSVRVVASGRGA